MGWVIAGCAYLIGCETLWRMNDTSVPYEFGKYSVILAVVTAMCFRRQRATTSLPIIYMALLVPSAFLTITAMNFDDLRQTLSSELSGPLAYTVCGLFLLGRKLPREDVIRCMLTMLAPILGVAALTLYGIETIEIQFGRSSNVEASGGFGPNQVSSVLGLGIVLCFLILTGRKEKLVWKAMLASLMVWFGIQAVLTFSRSGLYFSVAAILAAAAFLVADVRRFSLMLVLGLALAGLGKFVIAPRLNAFTGGAMEDRFANKDLTGRQYLIRGDLMVFMEHPVLGVGVGMSREARREVIGLSKRSHTEFTRLLSEHGILGATALVLILVMSARCVMSQTAGWPRAFSTAMVVFALMFLSGTGMRLAVPSFLLAFAGVRIVAPTLGLTRAARTSGPWRKAPRPKIIFYHATS